MRAGGVGEEESRGGVLLLLTSHTFTGEYGRNYDCQELEGAAPGKQSRAATLRRG